MMLKHLRCYIDYLVQEKMLVSRTALFASLIGTICFATAGLWLLICKPEVINAAFRYGG